MKKLAKFAAIFIFAASCSTAEETPPGLQTNGCGAKGLQGYFVPDSTLFSRCKFKTACDAHDICYGKCLEGGELYEDQQACNDQAARAIRKRSCDIDMFTDIVKNNEDKSICSFYGKVYRAAVSRFGDGNFNGREVNDLVLRAFEDGTLAQSALLEELNSFKIENLRDNQLKLDISETELILSQPRLELRAKSELLQKMSVEKAANQ